MEKRNDTMILLVISYHSADVPTFVPWCQYLGMSTHQSFCSTVELSIEYGDRNRGFSGPCIRIPAYPKILPFVPRLAYGLDVNRR